MIEHPVTPSEELVASMILEAFGSLGQDGLADKKKVAVSFHVLATTAAQWGADQELEACCEWANETGWQGAGDSLRVTRRPKPPSLKQQAIRELEKVDMLWATEEFGQETLNSLDTIRKALEALPDD